MSIFEHHIYEYKKGVRGLFLHTVAGESAQALKMRLEKQSISYISYEVTDKKCNIFFGDPLCLDVLKQFGSKKLNELTVEEDFILGIMLGYSPQQQYQRYLMRKNCCKCGCLGRKASSQKPEHIQKGRGEKKCSCQGNRGQKCQCREAEKISHKIMISGKGGRNGCIA